MSLSFFNLRLIVRHLAPNLIACLCTIVLAMGFTQSAQSAIFACQSGENTIFQDVPCPLEKTEERKKKANNIYPLGIHASWFDIPEQAVERAFCDRRACECGATEKEHKSSIIRAIADALYIDGSWHRYEFSYQTWLKTPASSTESFEAQRQMMEASCDVMMSQTLLRNFANDALIVLEKHVRTAEERGYDIEQPCLEGIAEACEYFDFVQYYQRIKNDSASLRISRTESLESSIDIVNFSQ